MNTLKFIAKRIINNHNNDDKFNKNDAHLRNCMYSRLSVLINAAKLGELQIENKDNKVIITNPFDKSYNTKNDISIYKRSKYHKELIDFFMGLTRTNNVIGFLNWFKHINLNNEDKHRQDNLIIHRYDNSTSIVAKASAF